MTGATCTYGQLKASALRVASGLHRQGLKKGDKVLVFSINCIDFTILMLACSKLGLWFSPANPTFTPGFLFNCCVVMNIKLRSCFAIIFIAKLTETVYIFIAQCSDSSSSKLLFPYIAHTSPIVY